MDSLLAEAAKQLPGLVVLVILVIVGMRSALQIKDVLASMQSSFSETVKEIQDRAEKQQDRAWASVKEVQSGCAAHNGMMRDTLDKTTTAVGNLCKELEFFRSANQKRGEAS